MFSYRIEQAIRAAAILHQGQVRKGNAPIPYISHLVAVAFIVMDYTDDEDVVIAALLHDTLEDTDYTATELEADFGEKVKQIVAAVSEPKKATGLTWAERKKTYASQLKTAPSGALIVSAADKIHNMRCSVEDYYDHSKRFVKDFGGTLTQRHLQYEEISNILNRRLKNDIIAEFNHVFTEYKKFLSHVEKQQNRSKN